MNIDRLKEEIKTILLRNFDNDKYLWSKAEDEILSWHTSTLQSFIEAEIANEENAEAPADSEYDLEALHEGFFMAKQETISHLKELKY